MNGVTLNSQSFGRGMLFFSLQGVVNQTAPHVFLDVDLNDLHDADWLKVMEIRHGISSVPVTVRAMTGPGAVTCARRCVLS